MIDLDVPTTRDELWAATHAERAALVADLDGLPRPRRVDRHASHTAVADEYGATR